MLLRRLEVAESELLASCQRASDAPSDSSDSGAAGSAGEPKDSELLAALVGAKVEVAQKDYAIMELQGALKHSEARVKYVVIGTAVCDHYVDTAIGAMKDNNGFFHYSNSFKAANFLLYMQIPGGSVAVG